jgi:Hypothetical protein (DUF2513)
MKMDVNVMREILLQLEAIPAGKATYRFNFEGKDSVEIMEHAQLLIDAGFVEGSIIRVSMGEPVKMVIKRLTLAGHQFLANARNDTIWKRAVAKAEEKGVSTSLVILNSLLEAFAKKYVGLE